MNTQNMYWHKDYRNLRKSLKDKIIIMLIIYQRKRKYNNFIFRL